MNGEPLLCLACGRGVETHSGPFLLCDRTLSQDEIDERMAEFAGAFPGVEVWNGTAHIPGKPICMAGCEEH